MTAEQWADRIRPYVISSLQSILAAGRLLAEAKAGLSYGEWCRLFNGLLPFSRQTGSRLMKIASHPVLSDGAHMHQLPSAWSVLNEMSQFEPVLLAQLLDTAAITPATSKRAVVALYHQHNTRPEPVKPPAKRSRAAVQERHERIQQLAAEGASIEQIAADIGITERPIRDYIKHCQIDVPAERVVHGSPRISSARVLEQTVRDAEGITEDVRLINLQQLSAVVLRDASQRLRMSSRRIMAFVTKLEQAERMKTYGRPAAPATVDINSSQTATASVQDLSGSTGPDASAPSLGDPTGIQEGPW